MPTVKDVDEGINECIQRLLDKLASQSKTARSVDTTCEIYDRLTHYKKMHFGDKR